MNPAQSSARSSASRRDFLKTSGTLLAGSALLGQIAARSYAGEDNTIKIALVGCGGRGTGAAAQALGTKGPTKLWAMADVFDNRLQPSLDALSKQLPKQVDVPKERQFLGMDGYRKAIDAVGPGGVVLLTTPPAFRPLHVEYAVGKGLHVFMEKSFAVDAPGVRRVLKAGEEAQKKNLKVAGGLMSRHSVPMAAAIEQIHKGAIGEVITCWCYREHGPVGFTPHKPGENEMAHQIRNYSNFTWLNGTFILDWLIHNLDVCCWVKNAWPVSAQGQGGRQVRTEPDQLFDHHAVEYTFPDGTRMMAQGRSIVGCWSFWGCVIHGAKGSAILGEGISNPRLFKGYQQTAENVIWKHKGPAWGYDKGPAHNFYQYEHDLFFDAIRNNKPYNETDRCAKAAMVGILGRMAAESGKQITWDEAMASNLELAPGLDQFTMASQPPVMPDAQGHYPIAIPGVTKVL
jgi:myo-inositol 2-dehydrogenase / D-chiro-inositol 1-dehydrogenase